MLENRIKKLAEDKGLTIDEENNGFSVKKNGEQIRFCFNKEKLDSFLKTYDQFAVIEKNVDPIVKAKKINKINLDLTDPDFFVKATEVLTRDNPDISSEQRRELRELGQKFKKSSEKLKADRLGWWRTKSKLFRLWAFGSILWLILVFLFILVFNPFGRYLGNLDEEEILQMVFVMVIPIAAGGIKYIYDKHVK